MGSRPRLHQEVEDLNIGKLDDPKKLARDVSIKGHHGVGDYEIDILPDDDLGYPIYLTKQ